MGRLALSYNPRMTGACIRCGEPLPGKPAKYCGNCGVRLPRRAQPAAAPVVPGPSGLPARYEVVKFLGSGAMGRVYRCRDVELDVEVAVKILLHEVAADEGALQRIRKEARAAARLRECPGILNLYGFEKSGESWYLVMEYAPGGTLLDRLKAERAIPEADCRRLGAEVADALAFAHERNVLHRDIKPANILFAEGGRAMVGDFGLARIFEDGDGKPRPVTMAGTPLYMAPEILLREKADGRADLFSLGCTLYEASTGERPFPGSLTEMTVAKADHRGPIPDPRAARPDLTEEFSGILRCMLAADPRKRFPDGAACAAALRRGLPATGAQEPIRGT